ncbi:MAG TPA: PQQ-binding-like beta-propeller repeat protein [Candidatus Dormibacteraeota bacterium]|nr:PQQ-binding-like beta-propeller repeat protein [Candidatus Dormibacteraeota bacterium]
MRFRWFSTLAAGLIVISLAAPASRAQQESAAANWPMYRGDLAGTGYSRLKQINTSNVADLKQAWSYQLAPHGFSEVTPIVVDGVMYMPAGSKIVAVDADTGKEIWSYEVVHDQPSTRSVAYWPGDKNDPPRIIFTTYGKRIIELDAATGKIVPTFGDGGTLMLDVGYDCAPTIYKNIMFIGANTGALPVGPPGDPRALDVKTGKLLWDFHTVPHPGEVGNNTWLNGSWKGRSSTNVWSLYFAVDPKTNTLFLPVSGPPPNYYGGGRPGANLFGNSLVAVNATTGKLKWYFQTIHHDLWDQDMSAGPAFFNIDRHGKMVPVVVALNKSAWMFILNQKTGKPVFGYQERPVLKGDVPGEWYSPTQPFPLKPSPLARISYKPSDIVTAAETTPQHAAACQALVKKLGGFYKSGPYTGWNFHKQGAPVKTNIQFPGGTGGTNWGGPAVDPTDGYVFVHTHDQALIGWIEKKQSGQNYGRGTQGSTQPYDRGSVLGAGPYFSFAAPEKNAQGKMVGNWPCQKPPWGKLIAVNANTGEIAWSDVAGITKGLPPDKEHTGNGSSAGPMATAGGLVFDGATTDGMFRAYDSHTGKMLWVTDLGGNGNDPMTYEGKDGKQYVAISAGSTVHVFALP